MSVQRTPSSATTEMIGVPAGESIAEQRGIEAGKSVHPVWKAGKLTYPDNPRVLDDELIVKCNFNGKQKTVVDEVPDRVKEPRDPDVYDTNFGRILDYSHFVGGTLSANYRRFEINQDEWDEDDYPFGESEYGVVKDLNETIAKLKALPELQAALDEVESFIALSEPGTREVLNLYERYYSLLQKAWVSEYSGEPAETSFWRVGYEESPTEFEIQNHSQPFFWIPGFYNWNVNRVVGEELEQRGIGKYSLSWGGYIVEPKHFTNLAALLGPLYHETPGVAE